MVKRLLRDMQIRMGFGPQSCDEARGEGAKGQTGEGAWGNSLFASNLALVVNVGKRSLHAVYRHDWDQMVNQLQYASQ